jgi:hypothetical protein
MVPAGKLGPANEPAGSDAIPFTGRIGAHALAPGGYRATLIASDAGGTSVPATVAFTVIR